MSLSHLKARSLGRLELLGWLNSFIESDYSKIEHLSDGVAYCQILDAVFPGKVPLRKVNFNPRSKDQYARNLRVCADVLHACGIRKEVPVQRISSGKFQENYEFLSWCHELVNQVYPEANRTYQGQTRRSEVLYASSLLSNKQTPPPAARQRPMSPDSRSPKLQQQQGYQRMNPNLTTAKVSLLSNNMKGLERALSGSSGLETVLSGSAFGVEEKDMISGLEKPPVESQQQEETVLEEEASETNTISPIKHNVQRDPSPPFSSTCDPLICIQEMLDGKMFSSSYDENQGEFSEKLFSEVIANLERDLTIRYMQQNDLQNKIEELSTERDTYYKTLVSIENICKPADSDQESPPSTNSKTSEEILHILAEPSQDIPSSKAKQGTNLYIV